MTVDIMNAELSNPYEVRDKFLQGDIEALETEMVARWSGFGVSSTPEAEKIERIQRRVNTLHAVVGKEFVQSPYHSFYNTSDVTTNPPQIDNHIISELFLFGLAEDLSGGRSSRMKLTEQGTNFVQHMYKTYVEDLQPKAATRKVPNPAPSGNDNV